MAEKLWWAAVATPMISTASHRLDAMAANATGTARRALISMVVLRARLMLQPMAMNRDDSQPPAMLPTSLIR